MSKLKITYYPVSKLNIYPGSPRKHNDRQVRKLAAFIDECGWINPIVVNRKKKILAGHGRL